ncbi:Uncharacterized protein EJ110_NYTH21390 [Nymphaea thermarum]|nr:Uncharacterized protein EJ110_NYTH21390 [Nymphaea thermarum]
MRSREANLYPPHCRRRRSASRIRLKRDVGAGAGGSACATGRRSGGPATPLLTWKFDVDDEGRGGGKKKKKAKAPEQSGKDNGDGRWKGTEEKPARVISARMLAAGLWRLQPVEVSTSGSHGARRTIHRPSGSEAIAGYLGNAFLHESDAIKCALDARDRQPQGPVSIPHRASNFFRKLESASFPNPAMERATKWDAACPETSDEIYRCYSQLKFLGEQHEQTSSVVAILQSELELARRRIHELEVERRSSKKKLDHFLKKLAEEKAAWRSREHEKIRLVIDGVKGDLHRERKHRQRLEIMNTKLVNELAEAKLTARRCLHDYEKERKARELIEEVCDELAKEIGEDKAEVEVLKRETMRMREEVEEERKMLQMAEVWREERVQMKLVDAKLTLEDKYTQLAKIQADLEAFLISRTSVDPLDLKKAELLKDAARSVHIQDIKEFCYQPPTSEDIFSAFEDHHSGEQIEKEIEPCYGFEPDVGCYSPSSRKSKIHTVSPEVDGLNEGGLQRFDQNGGILEEDGSVWDSGSQGEEQGSSNSPDGSDPSVNGHNEESNISGSGTEWEENADNICLTQEVDIPCSAPEKQSKKKPSSVSRLWRSFPSNGDPFKTVPDEDAKGRISNKVASPDRASGDGALTPRSIGHWSSPETANPHITRGMKGCIEWPRGIQKSCLKAKLLEARMECQKIQLRQALKQKI